MYVINPYGTASTDPRARIWGFVPYRIPAASMSPTIKVGDYILVNAIAYVDKPPKTRDVIAFKYPRNESIDYLKRVIGTGGDLVAMSEDKVYINGNILNEPYAVYDSEPKSPRPAGAWAVPENMLFVLGPVNTI